MRITLGLIREKQRLTRVGLSRRMMFPSPNCKTQALKVLHFGSFEHLKYCLKISLGTVKMWQNNKSLKHI